MTEDPQRIDLLVLARLATTSKPPSVKKLEQDLFAFVESRLSRHEWSSCLARRLRALRAAREIDERRAPTSRGLSRLREALSVETLPGQWSKIWRALMPALALQVPPTRWADVASPDKLRARLIRQEHELALRETPTLAQAVDAQIWRALGLDETGPLTLNKLRRAVLEQTLGSPLRAKSVDTVEAGHWLATAAAGTTTRDIATIRRALVSRWLFEEEPPAPPATRAEPVAAEPVAAEPTPRRPKTRAPSGTRPSLKRWAQRVQALAQATPSGRYGEERVFIASVWGAVKAETSLCTSSISAFKDRLLEANRAGLLRLHRADLVSAMDERLVRESEIQHFNATFHFIEIDPRST